MTLSSLPFLELVAGIYGTIFIGFGILYFVDVPKALSFFGVEYPKAPTSKMKPDLAAAKLAIDVIMIAYGVRDIFMGVAIYAAAVFGTRPALGWIVLASGCVAATDGIACLLMKTNAQMNHFSYAPVLIVLGGVIMGAFDWIPLENPWL